MITISRVDSGSGTSHNPLRKFGRTIVALSALLALSLLAAPAGAMAQDPTDAQYDPTIELIAEGGGGSADQVGGLPFTGFDVAGLLVIGACMAAVGVFLYRRSRHPAGGEAKP